MGDGANGKARQPRYRQVADTLLEDIRSGRCKVGENLPGELELVQRHAVSRHTVREALRMLEELGLIERQQGVGTVVKSRHAAQSYVQTVRTPAELLQYPHDSRLIVRGRATVRADRALARLLQCPVGTRWLHVTALRRFRSTRVPICWVDLYLLPRFAGIVPAIGRRAGPVYEMIERKYGERLTSVHVDLHAGTIPAGVADELEAQAGAPSLRIVRRYIGEGRTPFQVSVSEHPAERYTYSLELRRGWDNGGGWAARSDSGARR
jgi:GntR family transcriptional regulator